MHYVVQTDRGFELFASRADALNGEYIPYGDPLEVPEGEHYRGTPPRSGILFTANDQSSLAFTAMLAKRR